MHLQIYSLSKTIFDGQAHLITLPTESGEITVLPKHASLTTILKKGEVKIKNAEGEKIFPIEGGFAEISDSKVIVLETKK